MVIMRRSKVNSCIPQEQRYLILEDKVGIFEDMIHEDNEFSHDGSEGNFGGFACNAEPLVKDFQRGVGMGGYQGGHVKGSSYGGASAPDGSATVPAATFSGGGGQHRPGGSLAPGGGTEVKP